MNKNFFSVLFLFLVLISCVSAAPPFQIAESGINHLEILFPKDDFFSENNNITLHFHAANSSGKVLNTSQFSCEIHIYKGTNGEHLVKSNLSAGSNPYDREYVFNSSLAVVGDYPFNVWCNSSQGEYGFVSYAFMISEDGSEKSKDGGALLAILVLIPLIFGLFMLIGSVALGEDHVALKITLFLLSPITMFISFHFGMIALVKYYGLSELQKSIGTTTYWFAIFFVVLVTYFILYFIYKIFLFMAQKKSERLNY